MLKTMTLSLALAMVVAIGLPVRTVAAGDLCCPSCGCHEGMCPVCHSYCTMEKVTEYVYRTVCEDICVPQPSICKCCNPCDPCGCPTSCKCMVRTVQKLVKVPRVKEVPVKKCVVEWVCPKCHCNCCCEDGVTSSGAVPSPAPTAPPVSAAQGNRRPPRRCRPRLQFRETRPPISAWHGRLR